MTTSQANGHLFSKLHQGNGEGSPIILLHGIFEDGSTWEQLLSSLVLTASEILVVELPGCGHSAKPADSAGYSLQGMTQTILEAVPNYWSRYIVLGHSMGGAIATLMATVDPRIAGVINVEQTLDLTQFHAGLQQLKPMLQGAESDFQSGMSMIFDQLVGSLSSSTVESLRAAQHLDQEVVLGMWEGFFQATLEQLQAMVDQVLTPFQSRTVPYLALMGSDPGVEYIRWLQGKIPGAQVRWREGESYTHYPHLADPTWFIDHTTLFLRQFT